MAIPERMSEQIKKLYSRFKLKYASIVWGDKNNKVSAVSFFSKRATRKHERRALLDLDNSHSLQSLLFFSPDLHNLIFRPCVGFREQSAHCLDLYGFYLSFP